MKSKAWAEPLGQCLQVTGVILEIAGECGVPVIGLVGQALSVGADLLREGLKKRIFNQGVVKKAHISHLQFLT